MTSTRRTGLRAWLAALFLAAVLLTPVWTVVQAQEGPAGELEFALWGDPAELRAYQTLVEAFQAANPAITVRIAHVPNSDDFYARLATGFAAGSPPDVFLINYRRYGQFAARDVLTPVGPPLQEAGLDLAAYYPEPVAAFTQNGELVCLPQNLSSLVVYYNRDRFEQAGVPLPAPGWGWDDFLAAAQALTEDTDGDGLTDLHGLGVENSLIRMAPFIWQAGGELVDDTENPTTLTIDTPEARAAIQWFVDLS
ncbi:MAG: extracellular solute-binding protein, partial [Chloroflexia bacterium]|nr:extracellular solute-binding protein [Chloroflexia bacterium]